MIVLYSMLTKRKRIVDFFVDIVVLSLWVFQGSVDWRISLIKYDQLSTVLKSIV